MMPRWRLSCSFCGRSAAQVEKLVAGRRAYICDRCAQETIRIMERSSEPPAPVTRVPLWRRIWQRVFPKSVRLMTLTADRRLLTADCRLNMR
jgi:hypothetical protein